ncbi:hypothetical protein M089_0229 [Bacteroides ovatus str. 3725 D9 iii]|nr:hypothetical protein M089_0229 [Bacteroides ovatus str. 3725 D9 iii]
MFITVCNQRIIPKDRRIDRSTAIPLSHFNQMLGTGNNGNEHYSAK